LALAASPHYFFSVTFQLFGGSRTVVPSFLTVVGVTFAAAAQTGPAPPVRLVDAANPLAGHSLYVDPTSPAMAAGITPIRRVPNSTRSPTPPQAHWVDPAVSSAAVAGTSARPRPPAACRCWRFMQSHIATAGASQRVDSHGADYRQWIDGVAAAVGSSPAAVIVEPDALDMADCLSPAQRDERYGLIRYAVDTLTRNRLPPCTSTADTHAG